MKREFLLPDPGEGLLEAEIVAWRVAEGDVIEVNDVLVEIETAKSLVGLPSPFAGTVTRLIVAEGTTVEVGARIVERVRQEAIGLVEGLAAGRMGVDRAGDVLEPGAHFQRQPGDFYGGWITPNLEGQIKGGPGTRHW